MSSFSAARVSCAVAAIAVVAAGALFLARDEVPARSVAESSAVTADGAAPPAGAEGVGAEGDAAPPPCVRGDDSCGGPAGHARQGAPPAAVPTPATPGTPQLLEFEAAYCAACATMAPVVTSIVKTCARASEVVRRVDVAKDEGEALAEHYRIDALPTFLAVDAEGHEVFRRVGVQKPAELASLVAEVSGEDCASVLR